MQKVCEICGAVFDTSSYNAKFCADCKQTAAKITRAKWEERTDFKAKKNKKQNEQRAALRAESNEQITKEREEELKERAQRFEDYRRQRRAELTEQAANGDLWAAAQLAIENGDALSYWQYRAQAEQEEAERAGRYFNNTVGGISLYEPDFAQKLFYEMSTQKNNK